MIDGGKFYLTGTLNCFMSPKFQVYYDFQGKSHFRLFTDKYQIVGSGGPFDNQTSCQNNIEQIKLNCDAPIDDQTIITNLRLISPKYEIYRDKELFRFRLKASGGEVIFRGAGFEDKNDCMRAINVVQNCFSAEIDDPRNNDADLEETTQKRYYDSLVISRGIIPLPQIELAKDRLSQESPLQPLLSTSILAILGLEYAMNLTVDVLNIAFCATDMVRSSTRQTVNAYNSKDVVYSHSRFK
jgi:uncharacterized protein YegP (UPF0339 family)